MPKPRSAAKALTTRPEKSAQARLVDAASFLELTKTQVLCANAGTQKSLPDFLVSLADALTADAERIKQQRLRKAAKEAGIPFPSASVDNFEADPGRGVSKMHLDGLARARWVRERQSLLITGATQTGKSYLASAWARAALEEGFTVLYRRTDALLREWAELQSNTASFQALRARVREADLLVLDNFGEGSAHLHDLGPLREIVTERFEEDSKSVCVVSSGDADAWCTWMGDRDEIRAVATRIQNAYIKVRLLQGRK